MKTVLVIREGQHGFLNSEDYNTFIESLISILKRVKTINPQTGDFEEIVEVKCIENIVAAEKIIASQEISSVIFISISELETARKFKEKHRQQKVVLLTGAPPSPPDDEVMIVSKLWLVGTSFLLKDIIN